MDDLGLRRRRGKQLRELGVIAKARPRGAGTRHARLRIVARRPRPGFHNPARKQDVIWMLDELGPEALYGLRCVEMVHCPACGLDALPPSARFEAPGRILLYEQPLPPWRLTGGLDPETAQRLSRAGAIVTPLPETGGTLVDWPAGTLRRFMLEEVLLHELAHHVLQHDKGKRPVRVVRTRDHEAVAGRFARRWQRAWRRHGTAPP